MLLLYENGHARVTKLKTRRNTIYEVVKSKNLFSQKINDVTFE